MPFIYDISLATAGNVTTNGSANTENNTFSIKPGVRNAGLLSLFVIGKGAGLTAISGIAHRCVSWATASTAGTGVTPRPTDVNSGLTATSTVISAATNGSTRTNHWVIGCGAAGPGGFVAPNPDSLITQQGGGSGSTDLLNVSGTTSLTFEWSGQIQE